MIRKGQIIALVLTFAATIVFSQNFTKQYGKIGKDEIELKSYALDKDAEAVVLFDMAESYFIRNDNSFDVVFERTTRIKILSEAGIKWAEVEIPFYQEGEIYEKVTDVEAVAYNFENGQLTKSEFNASNMFEEKINNSWNVKKFAVPNVKEGTIIEFRYKIYSQYIFNFRDWEFQWKIPVVYSEYIAKMIPFYEYTFILQGANRFDVYESYEDKGLPRYFGSSGAYSENSYHDMVYKFGMKNVPAFGDEEFISSINDYIIKLDFQLSVVHNFDGSDYKVITTWDDLKKKLLKHSEFGKYIAKSEKLSSKLLNVQEIAQKSENEKFNFVLDYVKHNYNWNNFNDKFASKSPKEFVDDKVGNCADLNLFTIGLLNSVGIESHPLIISTRNHGKVYVDYPFSHFFNYVIIAAKVDGKMLLADATEILNMNNRIPTRCINDKGLLVKKDQTEWINLNCSFTSSLSTFMQIKLNEHDMAVDLYLTGTEYDALDMRKNKPEFNETYNVIDSTIQIKNQKDITKPYKLKYSFSAKTEGLNGKIYVSPFLNEVLSDNPLKQEERKYPIDMIYPIRRSFSCTLLNPEGYQLEYAPKNLNISNELFDLSYSVGKSNDKVVIVFGYYFKKPSYSPNEYSKIKAYFDEIIKKGNDKLVFVKNETAVN